MDKTPNKFMSVVYQLYTVVDGEKNLEEQTSTERPFEFITGFGVALDAFEQELIKHAKGDTFDFILEPAQAFGNYEPQGVHKLEREVFSINGHFDHENIYPDAVITLTDGEDHQFMARVIKVEEDGVTVDTNHPLAGKTLNFTGTVCENRDATEEEINKTIKMLTGGCHGCGHHHGNGEGCDGCGDGCGHDHEHGDGCGCGHCH
jgi:FKBP-type peptidyl-prolyl cis-trans isomerase SlyD